MSYSGLVAIVVWGLLVPVLFSLLPARRAVLASFVSGWLFLPIVLVPLKGLPDITKTTVTCLGTAAGAALFDRASWRALRLGWFDVPILVWCACPIASSLANHLGLWDGLSASFDQVVAWGIPYAVGRAYFSDANGLFELAAAIVIGAVVYVPLCVAEMATFPGLAALVYGYHPSSIASAARYGGWRPSVFLQHGLMLAMWMAAATLSAGWLWRARAAERLAGIPIVWCAAALLATTVALKSVNAWFHLAAGAGVLSALGRRYGWVGLLALLLLPSAYLGVRVAGLWQGRGFPETVGRLVGAAAAERIEFRLLNDRLVLEKIRQRPVLGWGRWARSQTRLEESTGKMTVVDSLWIEAFGESGIVGLAALLLVHALPVALYWKRVPLAEWSRSGEAGGAVLAVVLALFAIDNCMNAMVNPIYTLAAGGLAGFGGMLERDAR